MKSQESNCRPGMSQTLQNWGQTGEETQLQMPTQVAYSNSIPTVNYLIVVCIPPSTACIEMALMPPSDLHILSVINSRMFVFLETLLNRYLRACPNNWKRMHLIIETININFNLIVSISSCRALSVSSNFTSIAKVLRMPTATQALLIRQNSKIV